MAWLGGFLTLCWENLTQLCGCMQRDSGSERVGQASALLPRVVANMC